MRIAGLALVALSATAIALGLWTVGGPEQARREQRDAQRLSDLRAIARHYRCLHDHAQNTDAVTPVCPRPENSGDPRDGAVYAVSQPEDGLVQICAEFETPLSTHGFMNGFDPETGCLTVSLPPGS